MAYTEVDEKQLVLAYQAGDERAFDAIVRTQWKALFTHALRRLNDPESAEDAVQDTLLRAYRALPSFSGDLALRAWLHRILTNVCYDEGNRRRRHAGLVERVQNEPQPVVPDAAEEAILHDTVRVMASALQDLPDTYREALVLRYVDGLSFKEVAEATGITEENARARVHRGRQALSKVLARIAVVAGFLVPGLRRASQQTPAPDPTAVANPDHVSLVTQLTSHAMNAAPTVSRLASEASALPSGKSALLTGAIAAAAAVTVGGTAYTVHEVTQPPRRPPAAVAAPFAEKPAATTTTSVKGGSAATNGTDPLTGDATAVLDGTDASTTSTTDTTLPRSATHPFERGTDGTDASTTTMPAPTSTTVPPAGQPSGTLSGTALGAVQNGPNIDVDGTITTSNGATAKISGRMSFYDDGTVSGELSLTTSDGVSHALRFRGTSVASDDVSTHKFTGRFRLADGSALGLPDAGDVVSGSLHVAGNAADLSLALQGTDS